jgi:hypothetical protein
LELKNSMNETKDVILSFNTKLDKAEEKYPNKDLR